MILSIPMKKFWFPIVKVCYKKFYDVVYNFSGKRMMKLMKFKPFKMIFKHFKEAGYMERLIAKDPTFSRNKEAYQNQFCIILKIIEGEDY